MIFRFTVLYMCLTCLTLADFPFRDITITLPWEVRVDDIVNRLNLTELTLQMAKGGSGDKGGPAPPIPRLGIGPYQWNEECLRGPIAAGEATGFPQSLGLAAAFSPKLMHDVAAAVATEVRAKHNYFVQTKQFGDHKGLGCFAPVINIMRHPLWGRNQETYGEDPYLTGVYAGQFVRGLQGDHTRYIAANTACKHFSAYAGPDNIPIDRASFDAEALNLLTNLYLTGVYATQFVKGLQGDHARFLQGNAVCKHFAAYAGPDNIPVERYIFDAEVASRDLHLTFFPAFRACVKAGSYGIMCSYNSVNGIPACANHFLLTDILRDKWGFKGYVVSDMGALDNLIHPQGYARTAAEAATQGVKARVNLELSGNNPTIYMAIEDAVNQGMVSEMLVRARVKPLFYTRMRLGEFDPPQMNPYLQFNLSFVQSPEHQKLAVKTAMQSYVLLKNEDNFLPIKKHFKKIAIVGPMADNIPQLFGDYSVDIPSNAKYVKTPLMGLQGLADYVGYAAGCTDNKCTNYTDADMKLAILGSQLTIICVGTGQELEAESNDRRNMDLAGNQTQLIKDAIKASNGVPIILLVFSAGPVNISFADREPKISAIIQCFFPAQATGEALFNIITMATNDSSPAGRLPYTWYDTADQIPNIEDYSMKGKTYRYFDGTPLYPFGYGLSYSSFSYSDLELVPVIQAGDDQYIKGTVTNTGSIDSYEVIQIYISWNSTGERMPQLQLVSFDRVFIQAGKSYMFRFTINEEQLAVWTDSGWEVQNGVIDVYAGGQQPNQERDVGSNVLHKSFEITGSVNLGRF